MNKEVYVFEASENSFDETVLHNSKSLPVVVEFMGFWSEPCIILADTISDLANEFASRFVFVKVDIDENPELRKKYNITNVPTTKVFVNEQEVASEEGQMTEDESRVLLKTQGVFHVSDEMRREARELYLSGDIQAAFIRLTEAIKQDPQNTRVAMDMVQIFIDTKMVDNANELFNKLPESVRDSRMGQSLSRQLVFANHAAGTIGTEALRKHLETNVHDLDARFDYAICLIADHETTDGVEQLFNILEKDLEYRDGAARQMVIAMVNSLKENEPELAKSIQQRLANLTHD